MKFQLTFWSILLSTLSSYAQVSVYDCSVSSPNVPLEALEASEPGNFHKPCVLLDNLNSYNFDGDQELHITADETIHIFEDFHSGQYANNGNMHLEIKPQQDLDVLLMSPSDLYNVERFGKLELAVVLPQHIEDAVADFVANGQSNTNVNPFDPQQLEIKAYFSPLYNGSWQYPWVRHGFYYEEYEHTADTLGWNELPTSGSKFRIRFAPRATGLWRCAISVHCPVTGENWDLNEFQFTVIDTGKPDFVRIGENGKYLKVGSDPFYTWGMNMPTQGRGTAYDASVGTKPKDYNLYFEQLRELKDAGGNYFRYMNQPYSTEIEFENLGDYSDRMFRAWEMDRVVDSLETMDLRMHYCLSYNLPVTYTGIFQQFWWDWSSQGEAGIICDSVPLGFEGDNGYCYHTDPTYGVMSIDSFFTDPDLIRFYQNRLRYYLSRYGYSTRVGVYEFMNEINFTGITFAIDDIDCDILHPNEGGWEVKPYFHDPAYVNAISEWHREMARYIKEDLEYTDNLLAVNYGGPPNEQPLNNYDFTAFGVEEEGISTYANDLSYLADHVDIRSYSDYEKTPEHYEFASGEITSYRTNFNLNNKPFFFSEIGNGRHYCDDMFTFKQLYVMSPFTGAIGAGLPWEYNNSDPLWDDSPSRLSGWEIIPVMDNFFQGIDLNDDDWINSTDITSDKNADLVYLRNEEDDATKIIGVVHNRTVNRYSMKDSGCLYANGCDCDMSSGDLANFPDEWEVAAAFDHSGTNHTLKIEGVKSLKSYWIEYYDAMTGNLVMLQSHASNIFGKLKVKYPTLNDQPYASGGLSNGSMLLIKVYEDGLNSFREMDTTSNNEKYIFENRPIESAISGDEISSNISLPQAEFSNKLPEIRILPNPTQGLAKIELSNLLNLSGTLRIFNSMGVLVHTKENFSNAGTVDVKAWSEGLYFVDWSDGEIRLSAIMIVK